MASTAEHEHCTFASLPHLLVLSILWRVPLDARLRCAAVCKAWRALLAPRSVWARIDLSPASGVRAASDALLHAAAMRARGALCALDVSDCGRITRTGLDAVLAVNAGALRELRVAGTRLLCRHDVDALLLRAAPQLRILEADVWCMPADAHALLRGDAPYAPLRVRRLTVMRGGREDDDKVLALAADVAEHTSLTSLQLEHAALSAPAALDAVVDAALARQLRKLALLYCRLTPAAAASLARLLACGGALRELTLSNCGRELLNEPTAALLGDALRRNATLASLTLCSASLWSNAAAATSLLRALTGHPSLRAVELSCHTGHAEGCLPAVGAALGALVAANAPALRSLDISGSYLGEQGLLPLLRALPRNTHLRTLKCGYTGVCAAFARDELLPAVRANRGLRELVLRHTCVHALEAEALVARRES